LSKHARSPPKTFLLYFPCLYSSPSGPTTPLFRPWRCLLLPFSSFPCCKVTTVMLFSCSLPELTLFKYGRPPLAFLCQSPVFLQTSLPRCFLNTLFLRTPAPPCFTPLPHNPTHLVSLWTSACSQPPLFFFPPYFFLMHLHQRHNNCSFCPVCSPPLSSFCSSAPPLRQPPFFLSHILSFPALLSLEHSPPPNNVHHNLLFCFLQLSFSNPTIYFLSFPSFPVCPVLVHICPTPPPISWPPPPPPPATSRPALKAPQGSLPPRGPGLGDLKPSTPRSWDPTIPFYRLHPPPSLYASIPTSPFHPRFFLDRSPLSFSFFFPDFLRSLQIFWFTISFCSRCLHQVCLDWIRSAPFFPLVIILFSFEFPGTFGSAFLSFGPPQLFFSRVTPWVAPLFSHPPSAFFFSRDPVIKLLSDPCVRYFPCSPGKFSCVWTIILIPCLLHFGPLSLLLSLAFPPVYPQAPIIFLHLVRWFGRQDPLRSWGQFWPNRFCSTAVVFVFFGLMKFLNGSPYDIVCMLFVVRCNFDPLWFASCPIVFLFFYIFFLSPQLGRA